MKKLIALTALVAIITLPLIAGAAKNPASEPGPAQAPSTPRQFISNASLSGLGGAEATIVATAADEARANESLSKALSDASSMAGSFMTEIQTINSTPHKTPVATSEKLVKLIEKCKAFSALTQGAFDITGGASSDGAIAGKSDWRKLSTSLGSNTVTLKSDDINIDPNSFGVALKGFIADEIITALKTEGWTNAQIKIGNVTRSVGHDIHTPWTIQVDAPTEAEKGKNAFRAYNYSVSNIATAVISPRVFPQGIVDPRSKVLVDKPAIVNAIVFANDAATAAAYAIATYANSSQKVENGLQFIQVHPEIKGILIGLDGNVVTSKGLTVNQAHYETIAHSQPQGDLGPADLKQRNKEEK